IYRLPREQSIIRPRSRCPHCAHPVAWYDNIPLASFLLLRARCRHCQRPISWRYPLVESLTGIATVVVLDRFGTGVVGWVYVALVDALIAASFVDLEFQIIPDEISLGGLVLGILLSVAFPVLHGTDERFLALGRSLLGMLVGGGSLYLTGILGDFLFKRESMGGGDVKLLAMAGSIVGWKVTLLAYFITPLIALIPGILVLTLKRSHEIPYGPFLSLGIIGSLFWGDFLLHVTGFEETIRLMWGYASWR
ncbi:MAG: prepilin peptidase, partial [Candidatus Omnitrophica bacterium]|nr:prepilin peptidase [Candidatus Omnitrophota bacterium]